MAVSAIELALQLSDPALHDVVAPEQRAAALEAALVAAAGAAIVASAAGRRVAQRGICDPWSATRKRLAKLVAARLPPETASASELRDGDHLRVAEWLLETAREVLQGRRDGDGSARGAAPWYALEGVLSFVVTVAPAVKAHWPATATELLALALPHCAHGLEYVREAADSVVARLV